VSSGGGGDRLGDAVEEGAELLDRELVVGDDGREGPEGAPAGDGDGFFLASIHLSARATPSGCSEAAQGTVLAEIIFQPAVSAQVLSLSGGEFAAVDDHAGEVLSVAVAGRVELEGESLVALELFMEDLEVGDFDAEERFFGAVL